MYASYMSSSRPSPTRYTRMSNGSGRSRTSISIFSLISPPSPPAGLRGRSAPRGTFPGLPKQASCLSPPPKPSDTEQEQEERDDAHAQLDEHRNQDLLDRSRQVCQSRARCDVRPVGVVGHGQVDQGFCHPLDRRVRGLDPGCHAERGYDPLALQLNPAIHVRVLGVDLLLGLLLLRLGWVGLSVVVGPHLLVWYLYVFSRL